MQQMTSCISTDQSLLMIVNLDEVFFHIKHLIEADYQDGRLAPVLEIWSLAFGGIFLYPNKPMYHEGISQHSMNVTMARFMIRSFIERAVGSRELVSGRLTGTLSVIEYRERSA